jgi:hypothetical protein
VCSNTFNINCIQVKLTGNEYDLDLTVEDFASSIRKANKALHQPADASEDLADVRMDVPHKAELRVLTRTPSRGQIETLIDVATTWFGEAHSRGVHEHDPYELPKNIILVLPA